MVDLKFPAACLLLFQATLSLGVKIHPCRPNPCFNGGQCFKVSNNTRDYQCRCRAEYAGERCESTDKTMSAVGILCGETQETQTTLDFACPQSTVISVEYAAYGHPSDESFVSCYKQGAITRPCVYDGSLTRVMTLCHGAVHCAIPPITQLFTHVEKPCESSQGNNFVMEYRFRCLFSETDEIAPPSQEPPVSPLSPRLPVSKERSAISPCQGPNDFSDNSFCYRLHYTDERSKRKSWNDARTQCAEEKGDLVSSITPSLHEKLSQKMKALDEKKVKYFWIGARVDVSTESETASVARWISGVELDYLPDGSKLDDGECVVYYVQAGRSDAADKSVWLAKSCSLYYNWICQSPLDDESVGTELSTLTPPTSSSSVISGKPSRLSGIRSPNRITKPAHGRTRTIPLAAVPVTEATSHETTKKQRTTVSTTTTTTIATTPVQMITQAQDELEAEEEVEFGTHVLETTPHIDIVVEPEEEISVPEWPQRETETLAPLTTTLDSTPGRIRIKVPSRPGANVITSTPNVLSVATDEQFAPTVLIPSTHSEVLSTTTANHFTSASMTGPVITSTRSLLSSTSSVNDRGTIMGAGICEEARERGITWPVTREGLTVERPCPTGIEGTARWECRRISDQMKFFPPHPDLSGCRQIWFREFYKQMQSSANAIRCADDLLRYLTTSKQPLYGGDIRNSLSVISDLLDLQLRQPMQMQNSDDKFEGAIIFIKLIGEIIDFLMTPDNAVAWQDFITQDRLLQTSMIMRLVEKSAYILTRSMSMDNTTKLDFSNYALKVQVYQVQSKGFVSNQTPDFRTHNGEIPNSDAVSERPDSDSDFSLHDRGAGIILPYKGLLDAISPEKMPGLSQSLLSDSPPGVDDYLRLGYFSYGHRLSSLLQPQNFNRGQLEEIETSVTVVNSKIIGAMVNDPQARVRFSSGHNVTLVFEHLKKGHNLDSVRCVYWNLDQNSWDTDGCDVVNTSVDSTICTCNHLTSFAILMDITGDIEEQTNLHKTILRYLTMAGCALSAACLGMSILVFTCFQSLWSIRNNVHRNLCVTLLIGESLFLFGVDETRNKDVCTAIAAALHYFFLAAFCWMFMEGFQLYSMLVRVFEPPELSQLIKYYIISYGAPAIVVAVSLGLGRQYYGTEAYCWINAKSPMIWTFVGPVAFVILANLVFLAVALRIAYRVKTAENKSKAAKIKGWLKGSAMLLCLLGLTWVFGFLFLIRPSALYFAYVFTVLNSLQGVFIFAFHVILNEKVHGTVSKWLKKHRGRCLSTYYAVNSRSNGSSSESRRHWPTQFTASSAAASYSFPNAVGSAESSRSSTGDQREMMESGTRGGCRRRNDPNRQEEFESLGQHRGHHVLHCNDNGKQSKPMPIQIIHRTFDEDMDADVHTGRRSSATFKPNPVYPTSVPEPSPRHTLFISTEDRGFSADHRIDAGMTKFYYSTESAAVPTPNGKNYRPTTMANPNPRFVQHF